MPEILEGEVSAVGLRFAIVVSRFNSFVTDRLLSGALEALLENGALENDISIYRVPGSFEIPQMARRIAELGKQDAIVCLGALIRGETLHFSLIASECARGIQQVSADFGIPVAFGVNTAEPAEQAVARSGSKSEDKGWASAISAIEMANLYRKLKPPQEEKMED